MVSIAEKCERQDSIERLFFYKRTIGCHGELFLQKTESEVSVFVILQISSTAYNGRLMSQSSFL